MGKLVRKKRIEEKPQRKHRRLHRKKSKLGFFGRIKRFVRNVLLLALVIIIGLSIITVRKANAAFEQLNNIPIGNTRSELMIADEAYNAQKSYNIENIAIFGKDFEEEEGIRRSDTIMIVSLNKTTSEISITSIQRDTFVKIPGYYPNKINMAYFFGDAALAVQALNANLDMDIRYYVSVDMEALIDIVNAIGGIELTISETEFDEFNLFMGDINGRMGGTYSETLPSPGTYLCDGRQATVYARIRKIGNSDFDRTARQRIVLSQIYNKVKENFSIGMLFEILEAMSKHIDTNIPKGEIISMAVKVLTSESGFTTNSLCEEEYIRSAYIDGMQCLVPYYLEDMAEDLHTKIYGDSFDYVPSEQLTEYSNKVKDLIYDYGITLEEIYTGDTL